MATRRSPDGQVYTEVPVVPTHSQLDGRSQANQHPISAIEGLQDELDSKVDAVDGKGLSTEDFTFEEKAKLAGIESGAEANVIETVKVNGVPLVPADKAVDVYVPTGYGVRLTLDTAGDAGTLSMVKGDGTASSVSLGDPVVHARRLSDGQGRRIEYIHRSGTTESVSINDYESGAQENVIETVKVNGTALAVVSKAVNVQVPTAYGKTLTFTASNGKLALKGPTGTTLSTVDLPTEELIVSGAYVAADEEIVLTKASGGTIAIDVSGILTTYTAGSGLALEGGQFSLTSSVQSSISLADQHRSTSSIHVSPSDRTSWDGVASGAVRTTGAQTVAGAKTFSSPVSVGEATAAGPAVTLGAMTTALADGSVTKVGTSDVGTDTKPIKLVGGVPTAVQYALAKDADVVKLAGAQTVAGAKTLSSNLTVAKSDPRIALKSTSSSLGGVDLYSDSVLTAQLSSSVNTSAGTVTSVLKAFDTQGSNPAALSVKSSGASARMVLATTYAPEEGGSRVPASSGDTVVTEDSLSTHPYVVHSFGTETIAGTKTFTGSVYLNGYVKADRLVVGRSSTKLTTSGGQWYKMYEIPVQASLTRYRVTFDDIRSLARPTVTAELLTRNTDGDSPSMQCVLSNATDLALKMARRVEDAAVEVWIKIIRGSYDSNPSWAGMAEMQYGATIASFEGLDPGAEPEEGSVYDAVVSATQRGS